MLLIIRNYYQKFCNSLPGFVELEYLYFIFSNIMHDNSTEVNSRWSSNDYNSPQVRFFNFIILHTRNKFVFNQSQ